MAIQQPTIFASKNLLVRKRSYISGLSLLHPQILLFLVILLMALFTLVPPSIYVRAINEPDIMFVNPVVYAFLVACWAVVWFGMRVGPFIRPMTLRNSIERYTSSFICLCCSITLVMCSSTMRYGYG